MLVLPMIAASLVLGTSGAASDEPLATSASLASLVGSADGFEGASSCAKRTPGTSSKGDISSAKHGARGRVSAAIRATRASRAGEGGDRTGATPAPTRESAFVCPSDMVMIGRGYCIDRYEASLVELQLNGTEKPWPYFQTVPADVVVRAVSSAGVFPQGYVSGEQARTACERSGKRLCKPAEWQNACMGPEKTVFPYGNKHETGRCNDNGRSAMHFFNPLLDDKPEHRWMWGHAGNMTDPRLNQLEGTLTRTGEREDCTNEYGVFDMVGNLHEWVDDPEGTFQGGYYLDTHLNGDGCYYRTTAHPISHYDYSTGFRCCADVDSL